MFVASKIPYVVGEIRTPLAIRLTDSLVMLLKRPIRVIREVTREEFVVKVPKDEIWLKQDPSYKWFYEIK